MNFFSKIIFYFNHKLVFVTVPSSSIGEVLIQKFTTQGVKVALSAYRVDHSQKIAD
ncbi:MAG: hypothetical protein ACTMUB_00425 [cyanobacterium endosymbiont of Rhopalodia musculus]|uniref:hypothetical protein n=1 Tax=cyanobacterium endosymbiont of Epithemia clementina EcSB TaxID=3034674 RepID=UPI0024805D21|nr:hypothetical protein [cyanobacterium endosymbiont of Epithemia clementina EcSB]WGT66746.1 hypothetical protein P3F56_05650 [cyanobacterium endosymbiont of Epithemia clementina EcSB]